MDLTTQVKLSKIVNKDQRLFLVCKLLKQLHTNGVDNAEIEKIVRDMDMPLRYTGFILGQFPNLMELKYT